MRRLLAVLPALLALALPATAAGAPRPIEAAVDLAHPRPAPVPADFLGLSYEVKDLARIGALAENGDLIPLLRTLGGGLLRFGGVTADTQVAWAPAPGATPPAWARTAISPPDFQPIAGLSSLSGWPVLLTLNLGHLDAGAAAEEAAAAGNALGPHLAGLAFGNEPDAFVLDGLRPAPYDAAAYEQDVQSYRAALASSAPEVPIAGPDVASGLDRLTLAEQVASTDHLALLTTHFYPLSCHRDPLPSISDLFTGQMHAVEQRELSRLSTLGATWNVPVRIDETNNVACGGQPGLSNTYASALWALDFLTRAMGSPLAGVNFHGNPAFAGGYAPIAAPDRDALLAGRLNAQPEYYGLLLASRLEGDRPLALRLSPGGLALQGFAGLTPGGRVHVLVIDEERPGSRPLLVHLPVPRGYRTGSVLRLAGPALEATGGVTLGGSAVGSDGRWAPALQEHPIRQGRRLAIGVPPSSAALLTLTLAR